MKLIAICQNPHGEHDWWAIESAELQNGCIHGECDCTPEIFAAIDGPHYIEFGDSQWSIEHPTRCRIGGRRLLDCEVQAAAAMHLPHFEAPPHSGRYSVSLTHAGDKVQVVDPGGPMLMRLTEDLYFTLRRA